MYDTKLQPKKKNLSVCFSVKTITHQRINVEASKCWYVSAKGRNGSIFSPEGPPPPGFRGVGSLYRTKFQVASM
jgi:hypothetical protein